MKKEGKHITRWKTGATKLQGAAYLKEMAEQGWILEDMNHLTYSFREDEPRYLKYRMENPERALTEEELAEYAKDGWQKVCHYALEYVFVKERDPFEEDSEEEKELVLEELDRKIKLERESIKSNQFGILFYVLVIGVIIFFVTGFSEHALNVTVRSIFQVMPWAIVGIVLSRRRMKKLKKEKETVIEGEIPDEYTDWRGQRKGLIKGILLFAVIIGVWGYYVFDKNEVLYDLPQEINYAEVPAPRLENIEEKELLRVGGDIARQKAVRGDHSWHIYDNSVREQKNLFIMEEFRIEQNMAPVGEETEIELSTLYNQYLLEPLAEHFSGYQCFNTDSAGRSKRKF